MSGAKTFLLFGLMLACAATSNAKENLEKHEKQICPHDYKEKGYCEFYKAHCKGNTYHRKLCPNTCGVRKCPQNLEFWQSTCGKRHQREKRVMHGAEARPGSWPWIVSFHDTQYSFFTGAKKDRHLCGGTLITPRWVVTAAHCLNGRSEQELVSNHSIKLGAHFNRRRESYAQYIKIKRVVKRPFYHPDNGFRRDNIYNDLALIELAEDAKLNKRVAIGCLPKPGKGPYVGQRCMAIGWGNYDDNQVTSDELREGTVPIHDPFSEPGCKNLTRMICVGHGDKKKTDGSPYPNPCSGDSGGPLMCKHPDGRWVAEGVMSTTYAGCVRYGFYTPLMYYYPWIKTTVEG